MKIRICTLALCSALFTGACGDDGTTEPPQQELVTRVTLTFADQAGGTVRATFDDPDGDGGAAPTIDPVALVAGTEYTLSVSLLNALEDPPEDITAEVRDESDEHQLFLTGSAVNGPATDHAGAPLAHTYADTDGNGLPIGLENTVVASAGTGDLIVTLLHLPPVNDTAVKTAELASEVKAGGFAAVAGDIDVQVTFPVSVP